MKCLFPKCSKQAITRGLCMSHYYSAARLVRIGKVTWEQLENNKKVLESKRGNPDSWWFTEGPNKRQH